MSDAPRPAPLPEGLSPQALIDLHETAADWFMRRSERGWTGADERALNEWLAIAPLHREIFEGMSLISQDLHQIPLAQDPSWRVATRQSATTATATAPTLTWPPAMQPMGDIAETDETDQIPAPPVRGWSRRTWASATAAACVLLLAGGGYHLHSWDNTPGFTLDVATRHDETRDIELPDGSNIALNIDSTLQVRYYPRRREVVLSQGEAFFQVAADSARPFTVDSGASQVKVVGTAFNLRAAPPRLVVKVLEGQVEVRPNRQARQARVLRLGPGAGVAIDPATGQASSVVAPVATVGDWRTGQIQFLRTPLREVAEEVARYLGQPVVIDSANLSHLRVSGVLATANPQAFLQALPALLPLRVRQTADGWRISSR